VASVSKLAQKVSQPFTVWFGLVAVEVSPCLLVVEAFSQSGMALGICWICSSSFLLFATSSTEVLGLNVDPSRGILISESNTRQD
jgi:hypothetical protein